MTEQRLPIVNQDDGTWGAILRQYLMKEHVNDDTDNAANGGHQKITIKAGTASAGTAPLKFTSGTNLTSAEGGAMEYDGNYFYLTPAPSGTPVRKRVAVFDGSGGATGDIYYRDASGYFTKLGIGSTNDVLTVSGGLPAWQAPSTGTLLPAADTTAIVKNASDATKQLKFDLSGITSGQTRTLTVPNASGTIEITANKNVAGGYIGADGAGKVAISSINAGGTASSSTYLRGDGQWAAAAGGTTVYTANVGDGTNTSYTVTHNLGTRSINISVYDATTYEEVVCDVFRTTVNTVTLTFGVAPATNAYVCVITNGALSTTVNSSDIADATTLGRTVMTAASKAAAQTAINGFATTATSGGTTTLSVTDAMTQVFTGSTTHTVKLPKTSIPQGAIYTIVNQSTGAVTVQANDASVIVALAGGTSAVFISGIATPNTNSDWSSQYSVTPTASQTLTNKTLTAPTITDYVETRYNIGTVTSTYTIVLSNGTMQVCTLTASTACTFTMPTAVAGKSFIMLVNQAASTGNGTVTFTSVKWSGGTAPTMTSTAGKMDSFSFFSDGTNWYGSFIQNF